MGYLHGDPWEGCLDIVKESLAEWCADFLRANVGRVEGKEADIAWLLDGGSLVIQSESAGNRCKLYNDCKVDDMHGPSNNAIVRTVDTVPTTASSLPCVGGGARSSLSISEYQCQHGNNSDGTERDSN